MICWLARRHVYFSSSVSLRQTQQLRIVSLTVSLSSSHFHNSPPDHPFSFRRVGICYSTSFHENFQTCLTTVFVCRRIHLTRPCVMLSLSRRVILASAKSAHHKRGALRTVAALRTEHQPRADWAVACRRYRPITTIKALRSLIGIGAAYVVCCADTLFAILENKRWSGGQWCYHSLNIDTAQPTCGVSCARRLQLFHPRERTPTYCPSAERCDV